MGKTQASLHGAAHRNQDWSCQPTHRAALPVASPGADAWAAQSQMQGCGFQERQSTFISRHGFVPCGGTSERGWQWAAGPAGSHIQVDFAPVLLPPALHMAAPYSGPTAGRCCQCSEGGGNRLGLRKLQTFPPLPVKKAPFVSGEAWQQLWYTQGFTSHPSASELPALGRPTHSTGGAGFACGRADAPPGPRKKRQGKGGQVQFL